MTAFPVISGDFSSRVFNLPVLEIMILHGLFSTSFWLLHTAGQVKA